MLPLLLDKLLRKIHKRTEVKLLRKREHLINDARFFNTDYTTYMQQFKQSLTSVPEEMLLEVISMLGLQQYYLYTAGMKQFASFNSFQSKQFNAEMKGMLKTLDRLLGLFEQALPQNVNKTDGLTGIDIGDLKDILEKDYKERQEFLKGLLREAEEKMSGQNK